MEIRSFKSCATLSEVQSRPNALPKSSRRAGVTRPKTRLIPPRARSFFHDLVVQHMPCWRDRQANARSLATPAVTVVTTDRDPNTPFFILSMSAATSLKSHHNCCLRGISVDQYRGNGTNRPQERKATAITIKAKKTLLYRPDVRWGASRPDGDGKPPRRLMPIERPSEGLTADRYEHSNQ